LVSNITSPEKSINIDISKYFERAVDTLTESNEETSPSVDSPSKQPAQTEKGFYISEQNIKGLISEAIESALSSFVVVIKNELRQQSAQFIEKMEGDIHNINIKIDTNDVAINGLKKSVSECEQNVSTAIMKARAQSDQLVHFKNALNDSEQYSRRSHVRIHGIQEGDSETAESLYKHVSGVLKEGYNLPLADDDIEVCHRIGRPKHGQPRHVLVRFLRRGMKDKLFLQRKHVKLPNVRVYHDLTQANNRLLYDVKQNARVESAWVTYTGKIIAKGVNGRVLNVDLTTDINAVFDGSKHN